MFYLPTQASVWVLNLLLLLTVILVVIIFGAEDLVGLKSEEAKGQEHMQVAGG